MNPLTDEELAAMRERCDKATPGPWHEYANTVSINNHKGQDVRAVSDPYGRVCRDCTLEDMRFIAHVRTDQPRCLDHIEAQDDEIARLRAEVDELREKLR